MSFVKNYPRKPRKFQILLLLFGLTVLLIILTLLLLNNGLQDVIKQHWLFDAKRLLRVGVSRNGYHQEWSTAINQSYKVLVEADRSSSATSSTPSGVVGASVTPPSTEAEPSSISTSAIHIFYMAPVPWYKTRKTSSPVKSNNPVKLMKTNVIQETIVQQSPSPSQELPPQLAKETDNLPRTPKILNSAFYPALGLYKSTPSLLRQHFTSIRKCGIGVIILNCCSTRFVDRNLHKTILELAPTFNLSVTFEVSVASNQTLDYLEQQLLILKEYIHLPGFYRVFSQSTKSLRSLIYISNAYKLFESLPAKALCGNGGSSTVSRSSRRSLRNVMDALFIAHIRLKNHADFARRLCFDGFYSKLASNGATFASTWKNWSYLKSFAHTYKMLFIPTVGPGFAERHKFPRHGDIQRHRSNGRYYGVAWRTAILNHVGFINIASYNNWPDGSQIEEVVPRAGFLDYNPGPRNKYLELTAHWVGNFIKNRQESMLSANGLEGGGAASSSSVNCYELLNNTIC